MDNSLSKPAAFPADISGSDEKSAAEYISSSWARAQEGLKDILIFGAALVELDRSLSAPRHGAKKGTGLKTWLADHCPEINYKTAMSYKAAAEGLRRLCRIREDLPLLALMGGDSLKGDEEAARETVMRTIEESSLRLLKDAADAGTPETRGGYRDGAGRKPLVQAGQSMKDAAAVAWGKVQAPLDSFCSHRFAAYMDPAFARLALQSATLLRDSLQKRIDECRAGARAEQK